MILKNLVDIQDVKIDHLAPLEKKAESFIKQIKNPYHFKFKGYQVMVKFVGNDRLEDKVIKSLSK